MSVSANVSPTPQPRVRRKPAPSLELETRYPCPDPDDPFAPLSVLRHRTVSNLGSVGAPLSFRGYSTAHLPALPYTGGRYPPDIYQAYLNSQSTASASSGNGLEIVTAPYAGNAYDITHDFEQSTETPPWSYQSSPSDTRDRYFLPQRKRSQSAVSRKEARATAPSPTRNSPYGHLNLQSYILHGARSSTPAFTAEPLPMSPTSSIGHGCESVHSLASPVHSDGPFASSSSPLRQASFSADVSVAPTKVGKLARLLPKKAGSRLSLARQSTDNLAMSPHNSSVVSFPRLSSERSKTKHSSELNTFHARRKSTALFPAEVVASLHTMDVSTPLRNSAAGGLVYEPLTDSEWGCTSDSRSPTLHSPVSPITAAIPTGARKVPTRSQTTTDGHSYDLGGGLEMVRPSTAPFISPSAFDEHALPTPRQLMDAASCFVVAENGLRVPFGELFRDQKTIVIFVRHFWCPLCQDYMFSVSSNVDPKLLKQARMNLVVVGCGSYNMIKSYRQIFRTPFAVYTDPSMRLHKALGMTLKTLEPKALRKRGGYVRHGHMSGIAMVFKNALRVGMPIWEKGGDPTQLGGEFILGPGLTASYAHRMPNPRSHAPITRVLAAAGIGMDCEKPVPASGTTGRSTSCSVVDEELWMEERRLSLARIRERKLARRMGVVFPTCEEVESSEREVILPKVESRSDSIEEKEEEKQHMDMPIQTESDGRNSDLGDGSISTLSSTAEDGDTKAGSVESQTTSDTSSERTKAEEAGSHHLLDKVELDDCTIPQVAST